MFVERLELVDFRSYVRADVPMTAGVTTFIGFNGQGKTNLVEAVEYLSTLSSHRVNNDTPLVRLGAHQAVVRGRVRAGAEDSRSLLLEVEINPRRANRARINRAPLTRPREILGVLRTVVFSPNDLVIVRGDPSDRRTFLDGLVMTRWPRMAGVKSDYERVLKQRNALLKSLAGRGPSAGAEIGATMEIWDDELATIGAELLSARLDTLSAVMPLTSAAYREIAPVNDLVTASYKSTIDLDGLWSPPQEGQIPEPIDRKELANRFLDALAKRRADELIRGVTLVGPQRDDIVLHIGEMPAKGYASHGESWSLALALRLGSFQLLRDDGIEPVLVLDDVFAELDVTRRGRLASSVIEADQVLVTTAVASDVPEILRGERFDVGGGQVLPHEGSDDD
ncbi:DNA replication/repair protein RecF [Cutibacterium avidum]|uniref:DNA replication and repair protein RecF n=1 Tax=Cutibacterium avidum ATCC 25577 TaxID=997355 RepID=G4CWZ7_9ACTN|nr:DNA replication/repair protein RecF [Cutibacterium avidum]EGY77511.1 recombination protein F [Cutibacterium avidum ATCC 25577]MDU5415888.1 DNA replication/repair protein RecF [Cutibacterium avidum]MDU5419412.1 DNA replication/repair protein RecF [Cutibacterium avidum]MDU6250950.1 DNA replication/repair protein RecF [Cutibacterium avidum]QQY13152.1 DNA replication/repair protein RecF [Cutibacterium avidum]